MVLNKEQFEKAMLELGYIKAERAEAKPVILGSQLSSALFGVCTCPS